MPTNFHWSLLQCTQPPPVRETAIFDSSSDSDIELIAETRHANPKKPFRVVPVETSELDTLETVSSATDDQVSYILFYHCKQLLLIVLLKMCTLY